MTAANAFWRFYMVVCCCFMLAFPVLYIGAEAEKSAAEAKASGKDQKSTPTTKSDNGGYNRPEWDKKSTPDTQTTTVIPSPTEGYATVAFEWLKSPSSLWGWMRAIETMLIPGIIYLGFLLVDVTRAHLKRTAGS